MARQARKHSGTGIYHVMLRGINRQDIFEDDEDYRMFIRILSSIVAREGHGEGHEGHGDRHLTLSRVKGPVPMTLIPPMIHPCHIFAYCLMPNHVHLLLRENEWELKDIVKSIASSYVFYFNKKYGRVGHLLQDRFKSEPCDNITYFFTLFRYVHQNPVKAGMVEKAHHYEYSSWGNDYLGRSSIKLCDVLPLLKRVDISSLQELVDMPLPDSTACLDIENEKVVIADNVIRNMLLQKSDTISITEFQSLDKKRQKEVIADVMFCLKAGPRQMSRVSGMSYSVIQRLIGSRGGPWGGSWGQDL